MKKLLLCAVIVMSGSVFAARSYGPAGCGLGTMLIEKPAGLVMNVLQTTLNMTSGNQTFGMTSGTSNCEIPGAGTATSKKAAQLNFIEANKVALANDIAKGKGTTLASLSKLYSCESSSFSASLKGKYNTIFPTATTSATNIESSISSIVDSTKACI
jgi:hypothetical protein